jgi:flagellar protein FliT
MPAVNSRDILHTYGLFAAKSGEMLDAATAGDWDRLIALEEDYRAFAVMLESVDDGTVRLEPEFTQRKAVLIRKVLADDAAIRQITKPWMNQLAACVANVRQESRLRQAYEFDSLELGPTGKWPA